MNHKLRAKSFWAMSYDTSYKLRVTNYKLWDTSYELRAKICDMQKPACAGWWQYGTVPGRTMMVRCRIIPYIDKNQLSWLICAGWCLYGTGVVPYDHQPVWDRFLRSLYGGHRLQGFVNSSGKFNSIVVKTLKPVLCFSHDGVSLKLKKNLPTL